MSDLANKLEVANEAQTAGTDGATALDIFSMVRRQQSEVDKALPEGMSADRFIRMMLTEMKRTPKLALCDPATLLGAMMLAAQTGLEPGGPLGQAFLIPRWSGRRKVNEAQFQIGYKGYVQLAARSGVSVKAETVRAGDEFEYVYGTDEWLYHIPVLGSTNPSVAWWATAKFANGLPPLFTVIDRNVADAAKSAGSAGDKGPWATHYDAMAQKTALLRLSKWLPLTTDVQMAIATDGAVVAGPSVTVEEAADSVLSELEAGDEPTDDPATDAEVGS